MLQRVTCLFTMRETVRKMEAQMNMRMGLVAVVIEAEFSDSILIYNITITHSPVGVRHIDRCTFMQ